MNKLLVVLLLFAVSFHARAVLVNAEDDAASKELGASLSFMGCGAGWHEEGGTRYRTGSCTLIRNNETDGAWVLTAAHAARSSTTNQTWELLRYTFAPCYYDAFPKGVTTYLPDKSIATAQELTFYYPTQDVALIKLESLVYESAGSLALPIDFCTEELALDIPVLFGGYGETGLPSEADIHGTGLFDGYARAARGWLWNFGLAGLRPSLGYIEYHDDLPIAGIYCNGDSGGFTAIEQDGKILLIGINNELRGAGIDADGGFERLDYDPNFFTWMNGIIAANGNAANCAPVANAGPNQTGTAEQLVTLDGSASSDPDEDPLTYAWTLVTAPAGSAAVLQNAQTAAPSITPDKAGTYTLQLVVNDGQADSAPATVTIEVSGATGDIDASGKADARDVQLVINAALQKPSEYDCDTDHDGYVNARDVQLVINAVLHQAN